MTGWIDTVLTDEQARDLPCPNTYCNTYKTNYTCKACIQAKATWEARDAEIDALQIKFLEFQKASMNILLETCEKLNSQKEVAYKAGQKSGRQEVLKYFMHPGILRNSLHRVLEKYPQASGITLLIYCVEDIAENLNLEWGIV
jgi:hypothetical protein